MSQLLLDDRPILLLPKLVCALGFEKATIIQQIWYLQNQPKSGVTVDGVTWVYNTYADWCEDYFPFWKPDTLRKHINALEELGLLMSYKPNSFSGQHTKYYHVNQDAVLDAYSVFEQGEKPIPIEPEDVAGSEPEDVASTEPEDMTTSILYTKTSTETSNKDAAAATESFKFNQRKPKNPTKTYTRKGTTPQSPPQEAPTYSPSKDRLKKAYNKGLAKLQLPEKTGYTYSDEKKLDDAVALYGQNIAKVDEYVEWLADNWEAIKKGNEKFFSDKPEFPLFLLTSSHYVDTYLPKFLKGDTVQTNFGPNALADKKAQEAKKNIDPSMEDDFDWDAMLNKKGGKSG